MEITLKPMTIELCHQFYKEFVLDLALFADPSKYKPYVYSKSNCDAYYERHRNLGRIHLAVMLHDQTIGEIVLKNIDRTKKCCTMGITMINDSVKGKGYGTEAEKITLQYAFDQPEMETVYADSLIGNLRSQHVLNKAGFLETGRDEEFVYYRCDKAAWTMQTDATASL